MSACVSACLPGDSQRKTEMNKERKRKISADHMPPCLCCISPDSLHLSAGQSVDRCFAKASLEDTGSLSETPYANLECATCLRDTCSHSLKLGHVSMEPRARRLSVDHNVRVELLLPRPLRGRNFCRA